MIKNIKKKFFLHYGINDTNSVNAIIKKISPNEIYNLAAQSHVGISFKMPEYTTDVNSLGTLRILETIKSLGLENKTKFYQASTEIIWRNTRKKQSEKTNPKSPYASSKLFILDNKKL